MSVSEFVAKWRKVELTERSASQQHFLDLCHVFTHPTPAQADPTGETFTFEKGAAKHGGGQGWADVWKKGFFGWEYKGKHKDLVAAYDQLLKYREALESPPLLVVCDMDRFEIHTNFTATVSKTYAISLDDLDTPRYIEIMRSLFFEPAKLRPDATSEAITQEVAQRLAQIAQGLRKRGLDPMEVARFPVPSSEQEAAIAAAAEELDALRSAWLNPPEWTREEVLEFPGSVDGPWARYVRDANDNGIGTVRYPRLIPKDDKAAEQLAKRTLTNLYNERPTWLDLAHRKLDEAVFAAYDWEPNLSDDEILTRLLALNQQRADS